MVFGIPIWVIEGRDGSVGGVPRLAFIIWSAPACVGEDIAAVVFHEVDLAAIWPSSIGAEEPNRWPETRFSFDPSFDFEPAVLPALESVGDEAGGGVFYKLAVLAPVFVIRLVVRVLDFFTLGLDDEIAVLADGIFRVIPLQFFVADEAIFIGPVLRVWLAVCIEFIGPD